MTLRGLLVALLSGLVVASASAAVPQGPAGSAEALRAAWMDLREAHQEGVPAPLASSQSAGELRGILHGIVDRPFGEVARALADRVGWCAVLILDPNVHRCRTPGAGIEVAFGEAQTPVAFSFTPVVRASDYLQVRLTAAEGPFGTRDYAIGLEATPLDGGRTLVRLAFAQRFGVVSRLATLAYFNTIGRGKVGFTVVERDAAGRPVHVGDLRGGLERNLVRYYYAILAYFVVQQPDQRVRTWLAYTQRHPLQLREDAGYFERKAPEVRREAQDR
jgi:hypothetical protein